ncbi:MAG: DUF6513 domain-containing protein [Planctomycetota bacterium]
MMPSVIQLDDQTHVHFVTGKLAEGAVREVVSSLAERYRFQYSIDVMPITVAALMTPRWLLKKLDPPANVTHVVLPGYCGVGLEDLQARIDATIVLGPNDCRDLGELFGEAKKPISLDEHDIEIIAEINHVPRFSMDEIIRVADRLRSDGADRIDIGCDPGKRFSGVGKYTRALVERGHRVSIDTFDPWEAGEACREGATLVLSVNQTNREHAAAWNTEVVVVPDTPTDLDSMDVTIDFLRKRGVPMRLDPILEPIGAGLTASIVRYASVRKRYPDMAMMMGIGNLTELTDVDSAGVNVLLLGICQELGIESILTTQVINWARSCVKECDVARRLVKAAVDRRIPPKNLSDALVMLRDRRLKEYSHASLDSLAASIKDNNYRLFVAEQVLHLVSRQLHLSEEDPFQLFERLLNESISDNVDPSHAFYLGYELCKATIAMTLGKNYEQDQALDWGLLTKDEDLHRIARTSRHRNAKRSSRSEAPEENSSRRESVD